ncbi:antitoxin Xre/MbcA/ParS toxin-binding domain-containing protein [Pseudomonas aeruginosa]|uniref:antitoxin Xre/MbcA/ParS toxin-binding domain-containing protein n=1 Tax=Pseudomonas aeruginosa TaxID=287 RepID=UPI0009989187|nr:hypothetical protein AO880_30300 [Pseudomonas aeruginosa]
MQEHVALGLQNGGRSQWMNQPNEYLGGECPIDLVETEGGAASSVGLHPWLDC